MNKTVLTLRSLRKQILGKTQIQLLPILGRLSEKQRSAEGGIGPVLALHRQTMQECLWHRDLVDG